MVSRTGHGGGCCGVRHLYAFRGDETQATLNRYTREAGQAGIMLEAVLTNGQMQRSPALRGRLIEAGFRPVTSFRNGNSGNTCNVFHYHPNPTYHNVDINNLNPEPRVTIWQRIKNIWNN